MNGTFGEPQSEKIGVKSVYRKSLKRQGVAWKHLIKKLVNLLIIAIIIGTDLTFESAKAGNKFLELNPIIWQKCQVV